MCSTAAFALFYRRFFRIFQITAQLAGGEALKDHLLGGRRHMPIGVAGRQAFVVLIFVQMARRAEHRLLASAVGAASNHKVVHTALVALQRRVASRVTIYAAGRRENFERLGKGRTSLFFVVGKSCIGAGHRRGIGTFNLTGVFQTKRPEVRATEATTSNFIRLRLFIIHLDRIQRTCRKRPSKPIRKQRVNFYHANMQLSCDRPHQASQRSTKKSLQKLGATNVESFLPGLARPTI